MGSFSLMHWVVVVLIILVPVGIAAVAAKSNKGTSTLNRARFSLRAVGTIIGAGVVSSLIPASPFAALIQLLLGVLTIAFLAYWAVDRLRDMNNTSRTLPLLIGVPIAGFGILVYLMVRRGSAGTPVVVSAES
jgi:hypothetical protein